MWEKSRIESALKKFLKRKIKITTAFVVSFLVTRTMGYSEAISGIINETVKIDFIDGQITITPNPEGTLEGNTWTHNGIIDAQNGNGISIS